MAHRVCPICTTPGRLLDGVSKHASVEYYRCDVCRHVWSHDKANPDAAPVPVTMAKMSGTFDQAFVVERDRLQRKTDALRKEHEELQDQPVTRIEHEAHRAKLAAHLKDLRAFRDWWKRGGSSFRNWWRSRAG